MMFNKNYPNVTQLSLHRILMITFGVQLLAVVGIIGWFSFQNRQKAVQHMAKQLGQSITTKLEHHLHHYFDRPYQLLQVQALAIENTILDINNQAQIEKNFQNLLQQQPNINQIFINNHSQVLFEVHRRSISRLLNQKNQHQIPQHPIDQFTWSPTFQSSSLGTLSINALIPISNPSQSLDGILGVEIALSPLKTLLHDLELSASSQAYILEASGQLIASSSPDLTGTHPTSELFQTATAYFIEKFGALHHIDHPDHCKFNFQGKQQQVYIQPFQTLNGLDWLVMVIIPTDDFTDAVRQHTQITLLLSGLALMGLTALAIWVARWIATPLQRFSQAASSVTATSGISTFEPVGIEELNLLRTGWNQIIQQIEQRTQQLQASHQKLSQMFHDSPVASCISRLQDGCLLEVNETFLRYLGYTREEVIGHTSQALNLWVNFQDRQHLMALLRRRGAVANHEIQLRQKSGEMITVEVFGTLTEVNHEPCLLLAGLDITQRKRGELEQDLYASRLQMQQIVMLELSKSAELYTGDLNAVLQKITTTAAYLLDVDRVSVWFCEANGTKLRCGNLYQLSLHQHSTGEILLTADIPHYFNTLATHPLMAVDDVATDERMQELWLSYLEPLGVTARLDIAIRSEGQTVGILSLEQVNSPRHWLTDEQNFAAYLAHLIALALEARDHAKAEAALRASEERFRQLAENIDSVFWMLDPHQRQIIYVSPAYERIWGRSVAEVYADQMAFVNAIHPDDQQKMIHNMAKNQQQAKEIEYRIIRPDGEIRWLRDRAFPIYNQAGQLYRITGIAEDITQRKKTEEELQTSLREKEVLLREIHHRVKNNLHIVSSLLDLQSNTLENEALIEVFADSQNRIQSMALIHEQLYQSPDLGEVEFGAYIHRLMENLCFSLDPTLTQVKPVITVDSVYLNLETAIPCGLLINELITNAFKHAFSPDRSGEIHVEFYQQQQLTLTIWDNGMGIPPEIDWKNHSSLGLKLVHILSQQLKAKIKTDFSQGTYFQFMFDPLEYQRRF